MKMYVRYFPALIGCPAFVAYISNEVQNATSSSFWIIPGQEHLFD
jgi:hypothetical protein